MEYESTPPTKYEYELYLASDENTDNTPIKESKVHNITTKQSYKPHQARFENPLCNITSSSVTDDLLILRTPTEFDSDTESLVDSGATRDFISERYVRDNQLSMHRLPKPLRIRLADGSMSMERWGVNLKLRIGDTWLTREFVSTRLAGRNQLILGYSFLQETNPIINWTDGTLRLPDADTALQAIVQKRTVAS